VRTKTCYLTRSLKAQRSRIARGPFARLRVWGPRGRVLGRLLTFSPNSGPNPRRFLTRSLKAQRSRIARGPFARLRVWGPRGRVLGRLLTFAPIPRPKPCPQSSNTGRRPAVMCSLEPCGAPIPAGYSPLAGACGFLGFDCDLDLLDYPHDSRLFSCFCCRRVVVGFNYDYSEAGALKVREAA
jgi:hypothetical protein